MHPRATRSRPLLYLGSNGSQIYLNNTRESSNIGCALMSAILSPDVLVKSSLVVQADAISCMKTMDKIILVGGEHLSSFIVSFWNGTNNSSEPEVVVSIFAPMNWTPQDFLDVVERSFTSHGVISLVRGYMLNGTKYPHVIINMIQNDFFKI